MKLTKILESVLTTEIGDASAEGFSLLKPNVKGAINKALDKLNSSESKRNYGGEEPFKIRYTASIGTNKYNIDISGMVRNTTSGTSPRFTYLFNPDGTKKQGSLNIRVDFDMKRDSKKDSFTSTELNEQYKVLSAVFNSVLNFVNQTEATTPVSQIDMHPSNDKGTDTATDSKRGRFYMAYIQKNIDKLPDSSMWEVNLNISDNYIDLSRIPPPIATKKTKKK
jgi:hypothetical protein